MISGCRAASKRPSTTITTSHCFVGRKNPGSSILVFGDSLSGARVYGAAGYFGIAALDITPHGNWNIRLSSNIVGPYQSVRRAGCGPASRTLFFR